MTLPQGDYHPTPLPGLTQLDSRPIMSTHHDVESLGPTPQEVSPIEATRVCDHVEPIRDTISKASQDQEPFDKLDLVPEETKTSVDSNSATLKGGVSTTQPPFSPLSPTAKSCITVSEGFVSDSDEERPTKRPPILKSLGLWASVTIAGGTALTFAVLAFLIFLWDGEGPAGGETATYVWRKIMLSESWSAQTITICSLVVRTVAAAQAAVCTSLVAALLLERRRLPLSKAIPVSIKRGVNDGPFNFVQELFTWRYLKPFFCVEMILLLIVTAVTFGTQFTSTILLSGFGTTTLVQFPEQLHHNVLLSAKAATKAHQINSFSQFPPSYALFGELETSDSPDPNPLGVSDTGEKLRSFVPFEKEERAKLRAYTGPAFSESTQVMCMKPNMDAEIVWAKSTTELGTMPGTYVSGTISYEETFEQAALGDWTTCSDFQRFDGSNQTTCLPQNFTCSLPLKDLLTEDPDTAIALCHLPADIVGENTEISPVENMQTWNRSSSLWSASANSWVFLTFSTNMSVTAVEQKLGGEDNSTASLSNPASIGEWQTYQVLPAEALNVTLCFAGVHTDMYNLSMSTTVNPREPEVRWDPIIRDDGAEPGQVFMGTTDTNLTAAERGILSISELKAPDGLNSEDVDSSSQTLWKGPSGFTGMFAGSGGGSWIMCSTCTLEGWAIPPDIAALFARTVHTTGRASWAIQNFLTIYTESWYAQILPQFDVAADIDVTFSTEVRIPRRWGGLVAALVMVVLNLVCVWAITVLYVVHTRYSRHGSLWHTVSQIMSEETKMVLEQSNQVKDREVEKGLNARDYLVYIGKPRGSEKVSMLRA